MVRKKVVERTPVSFNLSYLTKKKVKNQVFFETCKTRLKAPCDMRRLSQMINAVVLTVASEIKDDFHPGWGNNVGDF